jgi:hypothetical protein
MEGVTSRFERHLKRSIRDFFEIEDDTDFEPTLQVIKEGDGRNTHFQMSGTTPALKISMKVAVSDRSV